MAAYIDPNSAGYYQNGYPPPPQQNGNVPIGFYPADHPQYTAHLRGLPGAP